MSCKEIFDVKGLAFWVMEVDLALGFANINPLPSLRAA
jgi:hypothetical protein